jgi:hypothetical protein
MEGAGDHDAGDHNHHHADSRDRAWNHNRADQHDDDRANRHDDDFSGHDQRRLAPRTAPQPAHGQARAGRRSAFSADLFIGVMSKLAENGAAVHADLPAD